MLLRLSGPTTPEYGTRPGAAIAWLRGLAAGLAHAEVRRELLARLRQGWRPDVIERIVATRRTGRGLIRQWRKKVQLGESEVWTVPRGCNVFPEK